MQVYIDFFMAHSTLSLAWVGLLIAIIVVTLKEKNKKFKVISIIEATHLVNRENGVFVDLRAPEEFKHAHINNSLSLLPSQLSDKHHPHLDAHKSDPVILVCKTGQTAMSKADSLVENGFEQVYVLKDGLVAWNEQNLPLVGKKKLTKEERKQHRKGSAKSDQTIEDDDSDAEIKEDEQIKSINENIVSEEVHLTQDQSNNTLITDETDQPSIDSTEKKAETDK